MSAKTPSYVGLKPASETSSRIKHANHNVDTKHELLLRSTLWQMGLRYRKNVRNLPGKPDIVFPSVKVVVFCDGDFWHGRNWQVLQEKLLHGTNSDYWIAKIQRNMERDLLNNEILKRDGWLVIRVWEKDIKADVRRVAGNIKTSVEKRRKT